MFFFKMELNVFILCCFLHSISSKPTLDLIGSEESISVRDEANYFVTEASSIAIPTWGPYIESVFESKYAELIYVEQSVPSEGDAEHIYWSGCDYSVGKRGGYAGLQHQKCIIIDGVPFIYNNIFSIWDAKDTEPGSPTDTKLEYAYPGLHSRRFEGEGTGLHTSHPMPWETNNWYATVIRRWYRQNEDVTHAGMFMYSYKTQKWVHYVSVIVPERDALLTKQTIGGFLERFAGKASGYYGLYGQHFKMHQDGTWEKPLFYKASAGGSPSSWNAEAVNHNTNIKLIAGGVFENDETEKKFTVYQTERPKPTKKPKIKSLSVKYFSDKLKVDWAIDDGLSPQLSYNIEVRTGSAEGSVIAHKSDIIPHQRTCFLKLPNDLAPGTYFVTLGITSIFNDVSNVEFSSFEKNNSIYPAWDVNTDYQLET